MLRAQCHCRPCQYFSGGAANMFMLMPPEGFRYTKGEPRRFKRDDLENAGHARVLRRLRRSSDYAPPRPSRHHPQGRHARRSEPVRFVADGDQHQGQAGVQLHRRGRADLRGAAAAVGAAGRAPSPRSGEGGGRTPTDGVRRAGTRRRRLAVTVAQACRPGSSGPHPIRPSGPPSPASWGRKSRASKRDLRMRWVSDRIYSLRPPLLRRRRPRALVVEQLARGARALPAIGSRDPRPARR